MRTGRLVLILALVALTAGCSGSKMVFVDSRPQGAQIYLDNRQAGEKTPATLNVSTEQTEHIISVRGDGFVESYAKVVKHIKGPGEVAAETTGAALCSPCCCGMPIIFQIFSLLSPEYYVEFEPCSLNFSLQPEGQGIRVRTREEGFSVLLNGKFSGTTVKVTPRDDYAELMVRVDSSGDYALQVKKDGFTEWNETVRVNKEQYADLTIIPERVGAANHHDKKPKPQKPPEPEKKPEEKK